MILMCCTSGHDQPYVRTYQLQSDGEKDMINLQKQKKTANYCKKKTTDMKSLITKGGTVVNPKGTVYLEANSATGSKFTI